jgi:tetratricopeptide (TPR) repeat protein
MRTTLSALGLAAALTLLAFGNSLAVWSGDERRLVARSAFVGDDTGIVEMNPLTKGLRNAGAIFRTSWWGGLRDDADGLYRPLPVLSFALDHDLWAWLTCRFGWGGGAVPSRAVNLALHALCAFLVFLLARRLLGPDSQGPWWALVLFALHPVHVEAVVGLVGRADLLMTLFGTAALLLHLRARDGSLAAALLAPLLLAASLLSKEAAVAVPFIAAALDLGLRGRGRTPWISYAGYALALAGVFAARRAVLGEAWLGVPLQAFLPENPLHQASFAARLCTAPDLLLRYARLLAWPWTLSVDYSFDQVPVLTSPFALRALLGLALLLAALVAAAVSFRRRGFVFPALAIVLLALGPVLNVVALTGTMMAERLLYLPSVGFAILAGAVIAAWWRHSAWPALAWSFPVLLVFFYAVRTPVRNLDWKSELTIFSAATRASPRSAKAWFDRANAAAKERKDQLSIECFQKALEIKPDFHEARRRLAKVYRFNTLDEMSLKELRKIEAVQPEYPGLSKEVADLLSTQMRQERPGPERESLDREATRQFEAAVAQGSTLERADALVLYGKHVIGRPTSPEDPVIDRCLDDAEAIFRRALALEGEYAPARTSLLEILLLQSKRGMDRKEPEEYSRKKDDEALALVRRLIERFPNVSQFQKYLDLLISRKEPGEAERLLEELIRQHPEAGAYRQSLEVLRQRMKKPSEAGPPAGTNGPERGRKL